MPYCANCGNQVDAGSASCPNCGRSTGTEVAGAASSYSSPVATPVATPRRTDGKAVASLVLGIVGLVACPLVPSIIALVLGNQSRSNIAADPTLDGEGMAKAGVILGWIGIGIFAIGISLWVVFGVLTAFSGGSF